MTLLLCTLGGERLAAQPPYRHEVVPGLTSLEVEAQASPELADLDGDGDLDLVVGERLGRLLYFENTGTASSAQLVERSGNISPFDEIDVGYHSRPELADLDGDGDLDAIVGESGGRLRYFENTGAPTAPAFEERSLSGNPFSTVNVFSESTLKLIDLDRDGDLDAIVGESFGTLLLFDNTGSPTAPAYEARTGHGNPFRNIDVGRHSSPDLVDLDGDLDLDLILGSDVGFLRYFQNTGGSATPTFVELTGSASPLVNLFFFTGTHPDLVDIDNDGDLDAVVGDYSGNLQYLRNTGSATIPRFIQPLDSNSPIGGTDIGHQSAPDLADLDGDGDLDAVVAARSGELFYSENIGSVRAPAFAPPNSGSHPFGTIKAIYETSAKVVDLDGDGDLDVVTGERYGNLRFLENIGTGTDPAFVERTGDSNPLDGIDLGSNANPDLADLDGDGDLDAIVGERYGTLHTFVNSGNAASPAFFEATGIANPFDGIDIGSFSSPDLADVDGDLDLDAFVGESSGTLRFFENTGTPRVAAFTERTGSANPLSSRDVGFYSSPDLADLDGDEDLDVVTGEFFGRLIYYRSLAADLFADGFETGDTSAWSITIP